MKVKITKVGQVENPYIRTASKEEYKCGQEDNDASPFEGYWIIGELERDIEVGKAIRVARENRNGVERIGNFITSVVKKINYDNGTVETENSIYKVENV